MAVILPVEVEPSSAASLNSSVNGKSTPTETVSTAGSLTVPVIGIAFVKTEKPLVGDVTATVLLVALAMLKLVEVSVVLNPSPEAANVVV